MWLPGGGGAAGRGGITQNPNYFFHGFAGEQIVGDAKFYDMSGTLNDASLGAELLNSVCFANSGYVTTIQPASGTGTATIASTVLTVTGTPTVTIVPGMQVTGTSVTAGTFITSNGTGSGGAGTYNLNVASTVAGGETVTFNGLDSSLRLPSLDFDYKNGQKLAVWWLGKIATPGATAQVMGDGNSSTNHGINVRASTTGHMQLNLVDASNNIFSGSTTNVVYDGTLHSVGFVLDGSLTSYQLWADEVPDPGIGGGTGYGILSSGTVVDTTNSNTWNIGTDAPASAGSAVGFPTQTRAFAIFRLPSTKTNPAVATWTQIFKQLRRNPTQLISSTAF